MMRAKFISAVKSYIGTPFHHQGRLPQVGLDCAGVVVCAAKECGIAVDDQQGYARTPANGMLEQAVFAHCERITLMDTVDGDILLFKFLREPQHLAVYAEGKLIHAYSSVGKVIENSFDDTWKRRLVGCFRLKGLTDVS
jgi:cell wall-associated NlpC family hydrolase